MGSWALALAGVIGCITIIGGFAFIHCVIFDSFHDEEEVE